MRTTDKIRDFLEVKESGRAHKLAGKGRHTANPSNGLSLRSSQKVLVSDPDDIRYFEG